MAKSRTSKTISSSDTTQSDVVDETITETTDETQEDAVAQEDVQETAPEGDTVDVPEEIVQEPAMQGTLDNTESFISETVAAETIDPAIQLAVSNGIDIEIPEIFQRNPEMIDYLGRFYQGVGKDNRDIMFYAESVLRESQYWPERMPIDLETALTCTLTFNRLFEQSTADTPDVKTKMFFIRNCFKFAPHVFRMDLISRGAAYLSELQFKRFTALAMMYQRWADSSNQMQFKGQIDLTKQLSEAYNSEYAQRVSAQISF